MSNAYSIVEQFEQRVADFTGAPYAVAVDRCRNALFLCCRYLRVGEVTLPARTYVAVPAYVIHAGGTVRFEDREWSGVYQLAPYPIWDAAKRFRRGMWHELAAGGAEFGAISFHGRKSLNIGSGGMILTGNADAAEWFRRMRHDGRDGRPYSETIVNEIGFGMYLRPDDAARGLMLLDAMAVDHPDGWPDQVETYRDLREVQAFRGCG